jgi:Flp pilus assembly protein CpaB
MARTAALVMLSLVANPDACAPAGSDEVLVVVAAHDLYPGVSLADGDLYMLAIPARYLPDGVFLSPDPVVGQIPSERILANEAIRVDRLVDLDRGLGIHAVIPRGMRAIAIAQPAGSSLAVAPGDLVELRATLDPESAESLVKTYFEDLFVLGVIPMPEAGTSVVLLVDAVQAEWVGHLEQLGVITLVEASGNP